MDNMDNLYLPVVQFPDLTEIQYMPDSWYVGALTKENLEQIKTEFIFFVKAIGTSPAAENLGFEPVSCMNNWYSAHRAEKRRMTFYWMRNPNSTEEPQVATRINWRLNRAYNGEKYFPYTLDRTHLSQDSFLAASGCGFQIGEPPFVPRLFHRFHTLMRMPVEVKPIEKRWLTKHNYRLLDTGKLASYWINGWKPEEYCIGKEYEYFHTDGTWVTHKVKKELKKVKLNAD